jgi:hypothetical protein
MMTKRHINFLLGIQNTVERFSVYAEKRLYDFTAKNAK